MPITHLTRQLVRSSHVRDAGVELRQVDPAMARHRQVRDLDARKAVSVAQRDALAEAFERRAHLATAYRRIGQASLTARASHATSPISWAHAQRGFVRRAAPGDVAAGEEHVAARMVQLGQLAGQPVRCADRLCSSASAGKRRVDTPVSRWLAAIPSSARHRCAGSSAAANACSKR